jgi:hypothetical protein
LEAFVARHQPDEIMATAQIFDHAARLRSFEILAEIGAGPSTHPVTASPPACFPDGPRQTLSRK